MQGCVIVHILRFRANQFVILQFIEKFHEVKEATRTAAKPLNGTTPTTSASASPVAARSASAVGPNSVVAGIPSTDNQVRALFFHQLFYQFTNCCSMIFQDMYAAQANQNELNSNLLKSQLAAAVHSRSQSMSGLQPVNAFFSRRR